MMKRKPGEFTAQRIQHKKMQEVFEKLDLVQSGRFIPQIENFEYSLSRRLALFVRREKQMPKPNWDRLLEYIERRFKPEPKRFYK